MAITTDIRIELIDLNMCYATYQSANTPSYVAHCPDSRVTVVAELEVVQASPNYLSFNIYEYAQLEDGTQIPAVGKGPFPVTYSGRYVISHSERTAPAPDEESAAGLAADQ
jgi:hypothetical protein